MLRETGRGLRSGWPGRAGWSSDCGGVDARVPPRVDGWDTCGQRNGRRDAPIHLGVTSFFER